MNRQTKTILIIGAALLALYLLLKKKPAKSIIPEVEKQPATINNTNPFSGFGGGSFGGGGASGSY